MVDVFSIYNSIDGEVNGFHGIGEPTTFIRLKGCNLRCKFCDTQYANQEGGLGELTIEDILKYPLLNKITITGGEPLLQKDSLISLLEKLLIDTKERAGKNISIETNGTISIRDFDEDGLIICFRRSDEECIPRLRFVVDYKLNACFEEENFKLMNEFDVLKFVVGSEEEYKFAKEVIRKHRPRCLVAFSPVMNKEWRSISLEQGRNFYSILFAKQLAEWVVRDSSSLPCRTIFSLQLHKVLWPDCDGTNER
jgi:7-carboxy-7-deazaguanine synthase